MYNTFRLFGEKWLRIPPQPEPPPGDEAFARVFRASPKYLSYLRMLWAIRTLFMNGEQGYIQAGAGIVADSIPEKEFEECGNKARAVVRAIEKART